MEKYSYCCPWQKMGANLSRGRVGDPASHRNGINSECNNGASFSAEEGIPLKNHRGSSFFYVKKVRLLFRNKLLVHCCGRLKLTQRWHCRLHLSQQWAKRRYSTVYLITARIKRFQSDVTFCTFLRLLLHETVAVEILQSDWSDMIGEQNLCRINWKWILWKRHVIVQTSHTIEQSRQCIPPVTSYRPHKVGISQCVSA